MAQAPERKAEYQREYRARNPGRDAEWQRRHYQSDPDLARAKSNSRHFRRSGITQEIYEEMLAIQGGCCAICGTTEPGGHGSRFHVDHDHHCCPRGKACPACIRGLLCFRCNLALGGFQESLKLLAAAINYLDNQGSK
jgi:hypothetical protein